MDLEKLIQHPEQMDKETLYKLRSLLALYPYHQTARLLMLRNLHLLHDSSFDEELRKAAIYITDRKKIFQLVEAAHYRLRSTEKQMAEKEEATSNPEQTGNRTISLIDRFLDTLPKEEEKTETKKRKPTPADATVDYVSYLLETESEEEKKDAPNDSRMKGQDLIDDFINNNKKIELKEKIEFVPQTEEFDQSGKKDDDSGYFTETLARIYIKQGQYLKALEIIKRLNLNYPKKNAYFADQIRFLEKLIINNNKK